MAALCLPWQVYPAGALIVLFDGALAIYVVRAGDYWTATSTYFQRGNGALFPIRDVRTKATAMKFVEEWLRRHVIDLVCHLGKKTTRQKFKPTVRKIGMAPRRV